MLLNLLVLYTFIIALFKKIDNFAKREDSPQSGAVAASILPLNISTTSFDPGDLTFTTEMDFVSLPINDSMENAITDAFGSFVQGTAAIFSETVSDLTAMLSTNVTYCYQVAVNCSKPSQFNRSMVTSLFFLNFTTTILPELWPHLNVTNDFSMSSSPSSTMAYTNETLDWMDYNTTATDYDYNSSTKMTALSFDFFNGSTTTEYDSTTKDDSTTITDTNLSDRDYDPETADDSYEDEYEESSRRRRKKRSNETLNDYHNYDEDNVDNVENEVTTIIDDTNTTFTTITFDDYTSTNDSTDGYNQTEFISSTIASFVDNITSTEWPDEMNTTYVSDLWTEYLTTLNSSLTDDYDVDENDNESDEKCFVTRCEVIEKGAEESESAASVPITTITTKSTTKATTPMPIIQHPLPIAPTCPPLLLSTAISDLLPSTMSTGNRTRDDNLTGSHIDQRQYCWETMFGQELVKLTVLDLVSIRYERFLLLSNYGRIFFSSSQSFRRFLWTFFAHCLCAS